MIDFYVERIKANEMSVEDVPDMWRSIVKAILASEE